MSELLFRSNHLIYNLMGYILYEAFGEQIRALYLLQALNGILAGISILVVYLILKKLIHSRPYSACIALLMAFSATWWRFASDANAYIPSILFLLITFRLLLPEQKARPLVVGLTHAAAMLFHQLAVFFFPAAIAALWIKTRKWRVLINYTAVSFGITMAAFIGAYHRLSNAEDFWRWIATHSADSHFTFTLIRNIWLSLLGNFRLIFGGRIRLLQFDIVTIAGIFGLALAIGWTVTLKREIKEGFHQLRDRLGKVFLLENAPLAVWVCSYLIFLLFWLPQNTFYRLFYLPAIAFLIGMAGKPWNQRFRRSIIAAVMVLFLWNFTFLIYPYSRAENNEILTFALQHREDWPEGTTVIFSNFHSNLWTISYFNPQVSWVGKSDAGEIMKLRIHGPVWLEGTAYDLLLGDPEGKEWLSMHIDMSQSLIYRSPKHVFRFYHLWQPLAATK